MMTKEAMLTTEAMAWARGIIAAFTPENPLIVPPALFRTLLREGLVTDSVICERPISLRPDKNIWKPTEAI